MRQRSDFGKVRVIFTKQGEVERTPWANTGNSKKENKRTGNANSGGKNEGQFYAKRLRRRIGRCIADAVAVSA
jgi:hypothetical protein